MVATHLTEVLRSHADELLGRQDTQKLLDHLAKTNSKVVEELVPNLMSLGGVQKVLQNLLRERVSIRDMLTICEALADFAPNIKDPDLLTEYVRQKLSRSLIGALVDEQGELNLLTVDSQIEDFIRESIHKTEQGSFLSLEPNLGQRIVEAIIKETERVVAEGYQPILLATPNIRRHLRQLIERFAPQVIIISASELTTNVRINSLGSVAINPKA